MAPKSVLIRKYENRRLYDSTNSRYVNLEEVAQMLKDGWDVRVVDAASGADITRLILTQIIVEDAKTPDSTFPLDLLRQMIVSSGRASQESALRYMKAMLDIYQDTYRAMSPAVNPFEFFRPGAVRAAAGQPATASPPARQPEAAPEKEDEDAGELRRRVAELEKLVASMAPGKATVRRQGRRRK